MKDEAASFLEDLEWSHAFLLNSMDPGLSEIVLSTLKEEYTPSQIGGPLTFAVMIDKVINLSETAIDAMTTSIRNYSLANVDGENVEVVSRRLRYALKRLENNDSLSNDLIRSLFKVFQTSSNNHFNTLMQQWQCSIENEVVPKPSYQQILNKATSHYANLKCSNQWSVTSSAESVFKADADNKKVKCLWCGKNHIRPNCEEWKKVKDQVFKPPQSSEKPISNDPLRYQKKIGSFTCKWCFKCGRKGKWTKSHFTDGHTGRIDPTNPFRNKIVRAPPQAHVAVEEEIEEEPQEVTFDEAVELFGSN